MASMSSTILKRTGNAAQTASRSRSRLLSASAIARKDLVQDLYLKEIKGYKAPPAPKDSHIGIVKSYSLPPIPKPPSIPSDIASELSAYDASEPSIASESSNSSKSSSSSSVGMEGGGGESVSGADAYLGFLEQDLPKPEAHHH